MIFNLNYKLNYFNKIVVTFLFILISVTFIIMAIPLVFFQIPFRHWYGIRFYETLHNKKLWDLVNKKGGYYILFIGVSTLVLSLTMVKLFKTDIFAFAMSLYIYFSSVYFYKKIKKFINKFSN